jgi:hypothetical protein
MSLLPKVPWISILAAVGLASAPPPVSAQLAQVQRLGLLKSSAGTQIEIQTSRRVIPLTQVLTDPDRLVIDFSDAVPSPQIRALTVNRGGVKSVRVGRVADKPPITRVVIDLTAPQSFQLLPSSHSVIVKIGDGNSAAPPPTAVAQQAPNQAVNPAPAPAAEAKAPSEEPPASAPPPVPQLSVRLASPSPAAAVPVAVRSLPVSPVRTAVMNSVPAPGPSLTISREPVSSAGPAQVRRVAVLKTSGATEIEIEISQRVAPEVQAVTGPDRLVIDFPQALPGPQLRAIAVNKGEVKGVRFGLLSAKPPVTRIVLDLKSPQTYQVFPSTRSVIVKLPDPSSAAVAAPPPPQPEPPAPPAPEPEPPAPPAQPKKVDIAVEGGLLSLNSNKASLAEVLDELRKQTGAEIVVPPGAEREEVAVSLGPAAPRDVIAQLLNGSRYNFIIVGADKDAGKVERLILTPKTAGGVVPQNDASIPDPTPVGQVETAQRGAGPAPAPEEPQPQPQGDNNPPPDTTPQPGDPQAAPN